MKKMTLCLLAISLLLMLVLCGCNSNNTATSKLPLSQQELESIADTCKNNILELCEKYGLTDAEVEVVINDELWTPSSTYCQYVNNAIVKSEFFSQLKGKDAFQFAKTLDSLENNIYDDQHTIYFISRIANGEYTFCYKCEKGLEYLVEYDSGISLITYKNGTLMHNIFDSKEYLIDLENLEQENAPNIDVHSKDVVTEYDATLVYGSGSVVVAISKEAMDSFFDALVNGNEAGMQELYNDGQIADTPSGTKVAILDSGITECKVKLLDGLYAGNTVWVIAEAINEK